MPNTPMWIPASASPSPIEICRLEHPDDVARCNDPLPKELQGHALSAREKEIMQQWPLGLHPGMDVATWEPREVDHLKNKLPQYLIVGPGKYAVCHGQSGLFGAQSRLIREEEKVFTVEEAAHICDQIPECSHFSINAGPDWPHLYKPPWGIPFRAFFCKGPLVSTLSVPGVNSFVGVKRSINADLPPVDGGDVGLREDGPLVASCGPHPLLMVIVPVRSCRRKSHHFL